MSDRYTTSIGPFILECEDLGDTFDKAIAKHEIARKNGAHLEDMGMKAHPVKVRCWFYGETFDKHLDFKEFLKNLDQVEFTHPQFGLMKGSLESVSSGYDGPEAAVVDFTFIEELINSIEPVRRVDVKSETEALYETGIKEQMDSIKDRARTDLGAEAATVCDTSLVEGSTALSQLSGLSRAARAWVRKADTFVARLEATLTDIENPANSFISTIDFGLSLPGRIAGAIANCIERYAILYQDIKSMPEKFCQNLIDAMDTIADSLEEFGRSDDITIGTALSVGYNLGAIYSDDEDERDTARSLEQTEAFDALGNYVATDTMPELLDVRTIEKSLAVAHTQIQAAVDADRSMQSLKNMARELTDHAIKIKIEREKLIEIEVENPTPLHLICLQHGLPYAYAERICKVNDIPNPNFVQGSLLIYAG